MFYTVKQFEAFVKDNEATSSCNWGVPNCLKTAPTGDLRRFLRGVKRAIIARDETYTDARLRPSLYDSSFWVGKFYRPWHVVPELRNFQCPEGDFSVGVEVEMGFVSHRAASEVVQKIAGWKNIAIDSEGGQHGVETTFPPVLYSKLSRKSQMFRYLDYLASVPDLVHIHSAYYDAVGTHVNVGSSVAPRHNRVDHLSQVLEEQLSEEENEKYFGRQPYGYANHMGKYIEYKLFNSVTDWKILRRYVDIAVALSALVFSSEDITLDSVMTALEAGYNKNEDN